ncbi:MAG: hypothetical protein MRK02_09070 [Candidatus Scalindua sp.]|nr:hypothetical protein [Candidatus Scalindua sp.]
MKEVVGLIPAGGKATRVSPLPCSKELLPIGFRRVDEERNLRPKVVCHYLLEKMQLADVTKAYFVLREGKWDIPAYFGNGTMIHMNLAYLIMGLPFGVPYTIDQAYPFVKDAIIVFGFPDIIFQPDDAFVQLLKRLRETNADIVLGGFPVEVPQKWDMIDLCNDGRIRQVFMKPALSDLQFTWAIAVWSPAFTRFMHKYLSSIQKTREKDNSVYNTSKQRELCVGDVIQSAIQNDMKVYSVIFEDGNCIDIGTPEDMIKAIKDKI